MNDTNDTIQFKTNTAARLYHNNYPILTTQNTYVSNNKGYINGTEITQVNNSDKVDNRHAISTTPNTGIIYKAAIYTNSSLTSYWVRLASISSIVKNGEFIATIHVQSGHLNPGRSAILLVYLRGGASSFTSKSFKICCNSNYDPNRFRLYYKDSDKTSEIWYQTTGRYDGIITTVISQSSEGFLYEGLTLYNGSITAVQTPSVSTYLSAQVSTITDNISGNASTATKLQTARSIWGQSFDGTRDVSGTLSGVANIQFSADGAYDIGSNSAASRCIYTHWLGAKSGSKLELGANNSEYGKGLCIDTNLNVGIGTNTPAYKLDVKGDIYSSGYVRASNGFIHADHNNNNAVLLAGGAYKTLDSFWGGDSTHYGFLGYLTLYNGADGTISNLFMCLGQIVSFTYTRGGNYCRINIPNTSYQTFYIKAAIASVNYSGTGMDNYVGLHRGDGAWWLHCYAVNSNTVQVKGFRNSNSHNDSWWGGNPLFVGDGAATVITVCLFGYVLFK